MEQITTFIENLKSEFGLTDKEVLQAIHDDPQHDFIMETQNVDVQTATDIIEATEEYLMVTLENPFI